MRPRLLKIMGLLSFVLAIFGSQSDRINGQHLPPPMERRSSPSYEDQLKTFKALGFQLNPGISESEIDRWGGKGKFEESPYSLLYATLGQPIEREPWTPLTNRVWDFDTEAIEDHGAYVEIMKNLERIARGEIKFENLKDYVDLDEGKAWVSFTVRGKTHKWDLDVDDDWADPKLFSNVAELTRTLGTKGRYTYFDTGGQNAVIGYETPEHREAIIKATGLKIEWLN